MKVLNGMTEVALKDVPKDVLISLLESMQQYVDLICAERNCYREQLLLIRETIVRNASDDVAYKMSDKEAIAKIRIELYGH